MRLKPSSLPIITACGRCDWFLVRKKTYMIIYAQYLIY